MDPHPPLNAFSRRIRINMNMPPTIPRELTLDERKAAHAAFEGRLFDPRWSQAAKRVYDGLVLAVYIRQRQMKTSCSRIDTDPVPRNSPCALKHDADEQTNDIHPITILGG